MKKTFCFLLLFAMSWLFVFPSSAAGAVPVESITFDKDSVILAVGKTAALKAEVAPKNATVKKLLWVSSDESVATVKNGKVKATACGTATITAEAEDGSGVSASVLITVVTPVKKIVFSEKKLTVATGTTRQLTAEVFPEEADGRSLSWKSSNEKAAAVDENGLVTGMGKGTAKITAAATDGSGVKAAVTVEVRDFDLVFTSGSPQTVSYWFGSGRFSVKGSVKTGCVRIPDMDTDMNVMMTGSQAREEVSVTPVSPGTDVITITAGKKKYAYTAYVSPEAVNRDGGPEEEKAVPRNGKAVNLIIAPEEGSDAGVLFLDDGQIAAEMTGLEDYPWDGAFYIEMHVTNKTKNTLRVTLADVSVNGTLVQTATSDEQDALLPRSDGTVRIAVPYEQAGIGSLDEVRYILFKVRLLDDMKKNIAGTTEEYTLKRNGD